jgi:hypothetical protein
MGVAHRPSHMRVKRATIAKALAAAFILNLVVMGFGA